ncbi:Bile acid:sodium symporter [Paludibacter propionicigenes WB4]|uniref:Bile acid:sodium symporter n=1 Tax=Paludibacter propionicigenes (strain DSM 17365 / JCM 13257 / WB4) TaxID=694427 RepID=E4T092_PALPW|nr:bile acid:sodium symporter family protein [Paludibacter propionicigenes]ADQ78282.1 Bile acid:sodium symporter [Paludibacter propionicigenes WB4]
MYEALQQLDPIRINFSASGMHFINIVLGFIMFGVALSIKPKQFIEIFKEPKPYLVGLFGHIFALPFMTFLLVIALNNFITPTIAMGMFLVAACPGGHISNFMTSYAKGNTELSVGLSASTTILATFTTPFNFALWGGLYMHFVSNKAGHLLQSLEIDNLQMFETVFLLLGIPLILGILFAKYFPRITEKLKKPIQYISIVFFILLVVLAFSNNLDLFLKHIFYVFFIVLLHNLLAFLTGFSLASIFKVSNRNRRTITIEMGIQNSGLGLVLLFNTKIFPHDMALGGMLFITAWWGIWHIISGLSIATYWSGKPLKIN